MEVNMSDQLQLLIVASIDLAFFSPRVEDEAFEDSSLDVDVALAGPGGWAGLLEAAKPREGDDRQVTGYIVKAWARDPAAAFPTSSKQWADLCHDQVDRIFGYLGAIEEQGPESSPA
jgi:hypothetical protein